LTAEDWLDEALLVMAEEGVNALAVEPLAKRLGVTKGSFYWHFKNRNELIESVLKFWEEVEQGYIEQYSQQFPDPVKRLAAILTILVDDEVNKFIFMAIANDSSNSLFTAAYQKAVKRRLDLFEGIYRSIGDSDSEARAMKVYCQYFGLIKMSIDRPSGNYTKRMHEYLREELLKSAL